MTRKLLDDCFLHDKDRLRHDDAVALILERTSPVTNVDTVVLSQAHGRVLAEQYAAPQNIPAFNNAAAYWLRASTPWAPPDECLLQWHLPASGRYQRPPA